MSFHTFPITPFGYMIINGNSVLENIRVFNFLIHISKLPSKIIYFPNNIYFTNNTYLFQISSSILKIGLGSSLAHSSFPLKIIFYTHSGPLDQPLTHPTEKLVNNLMLTVMDPSFLIGISKCGGKNSNSPLMVCAINPLD